MCKWGKHGFPRSVKLKQNGKLLPVVEKRQRKEVFIDSCYYIILIATFIKLDGKSAKTKQKNSPLTHEIKNPN